MKRAYKKAQRESANLEALFNDEPVIHSTTNHNKTLTSWIKKPSGGSLSISAQGTAINDSFHDSQDNGSPKRLCSPIRPSAVFMIQRFNYQEAKFFRNKLLEKIYENQKEDSPLRGLLDPPPQKRILSRQENKDYREDQALQFLQSQNINFSRIHIKRGPGRPPKVRSGEGSEIGAENQSNALMQANVSILNNNKVAMKREAIREALLDMLESPLPPSMLWAQPILSEANTGSGFYPGLGIENGLHSGIDYPIPYQVAVDPRIEHIMGQQCKTAVQVREKLKKMFSENIERYKRSAYNIQTSDVRDRFHEKMGYKEERNREYYQTLVGKIQGMMKRIGLNEGAGLGSRSKERQISRELEQIIIPSNNHRPPPFVEIKLDDFLDQPSPSPKQRILKATPTPTKSDPVDPEREQTLQTLVTETKLHKRPYKQRVSTLSSSQRYKKHLSRVQTNGLFKKRCGGGGRKKGRDLKSLLDDADDDSQGEFDEEGGFSDTDPQVSQKCVNN